MKKILLCSAIAIASLTGCSSSFLEIDPAGSVSKATLANQNGVEMVAAGAYSILYNGGPNANLSNVVWGDCLGGDSNKGSDPSDQADWGNLDAYQIVDNNAYILAKWNRCYEGIHRANDLLDLISMAGDNLAGATIDGVDYATELEAEGKFLRGFWTFELIRLFGAAVPYIDLEAYQGSTDPQVPNIDENGNYVYVWDKAAADLQAAANALPSNRKVSGQYGRATKWAAKAFLAKLYLYWSSPYNGKNATADHWNDAKTLFKEIIDNGETAKGVKLALTPNYADLWDNRAGKDVTDWNSEVIFDVQQFVSGTTSSVNAMNAAYYPAFAGAIKGSGWGFYCPSSDLAHSYLVDDAGLPLLNYREQTQKLENKMAGIDPDNDKVVKTNFKMVCDPRIDVTMGRFGVAFYDWGTPKEYASWIRNYANCGPFLNKKMIETSSADGVTASGTSHKNYHLIRLADVYLMYAECCIQAGDLEEARTYINKCRERAANSCLQTEGSGYTLTDATGKVLVNDAAGMYRIGTYDKAFVDKAEATTALKRERRAELAMEGQRWFDLARWGNIAQDLVEYQAYEADAYPGNPLKYTGAYNAAWVTMPIPFTQMNIMPDKLIQNENWK